MRVVVIGGKARSLMHFRGPLLAAMTARGHQVVACAPDDEPGIAERLLGVGVQFVPIPLRRARIDPVADLRALVHIARDLRRLRPDLLLSYTIKPVIYGSLAARWAGVPQCFSMITGLGYAFTESGAPAGPRRRLAGFAATRLYRLALANNRAVFFQNEDDLAEFRRLHLVRPDQQTVRLNGSGVALDEYPAADPVVDPVTFLWMGRVLRDKGLLEFVEAARRLRRSGATFRAQILGLFDVNPTAIPRAEVESWAREGVVELLGSTKDVRPFLARASVLVYPSYREGTPRAVLEAMATARPIITTDVPGCRDTIVDGVEGWLVPPRDPQAIAAAMQRFLAAPESIATMGQAARARAEEKYDVRKVNDVILTTLGL